MHGRVRALIVAVAVAMPTMAFHFAVAAPSAEAAGRKVSPRMAKVVQYAPPRNKVRKAKRATRVAAYKSCGTFMYRKGGRCLDARVKR